MADTPGGRGRGAPGPLAPGLLGTKLNTNMFRRDHHLASFLPTQSSSHAQAGAGASRQGALAPTRPGPGLPHLLYLESPGPAPPRLHLKLISDLGPWGIRDLLRSTQSLSSLHLSLPPKIAPSLCHPISPRHPNICLSIVPEWAGRPQLDPWTVAP